jgi:hypothetical protein
VFIPERCPAAYCEGLDIYEISWHRSKLIGNKGGARTPARRSKANGSTLRKYFRNEVKDCFDFFALLESASWVCVDLFKSGNVVRRGGHELLAGEAGVLDLNCRLSALVLRFK